MPKIKTHKGARDRFKATGTGKLMRTTGGKSHLRRNRSKRAKRLYDGMVPVIPTDAKRARELVPYMK